MTLEQFIDESIRRSRVKGYVPSTFMRMRSEHGTISAIVRLVETSEPQSGFRRMKKLGLLDWTLEAAVIRFPEEFRGRRTVEYARARLDGLLDI